MTDLPSPNGEDAKLAFALITAIARGEDNIVIEHVLRDVMSHPGSVLHLAAFGSSLIKALSEARGVSVDHALHQVGVKLGEEDDCENDRGS